MNKRINDIFLGELKRHIVHFLIKLGGRSDIDSLKKKSLKIYSDTKLFEKALDEVADRNRDPRGKVTFKLKEEKYLNWFDPFYFLKPNHYA